MVLAYTRGFLVSFQVVFRIISKIFVRKFWLDSGGGRRKPSIRLPSKVDRLGQEFLRLNLLREVQVFSFQGFESRDLRETVPLLNFSSSYLIVYR